MTKSHKNFLAAFSLFIGLSFSPHYASAQVVALGASVVQGFGVSAGEAFPEQLQAMLRAKGKNYTVANEGIYGDTTDGVLSRLDSAVPNGTRIVILLIGGNDVRHGKTVDEMLASKRQITARLLARGIRVIDAMPFYQAARRSGMVVSDGLHLNAEGQRHVAAQLLSQIR